MKASDLLQLLGDFYREKTALRTRHVAVARSVGEYDFNNTYQYVIAREDQHLGWIADAIRQLGGAVPDAPAPEEVGPAESLESQRQLMAEDAERLGTLARAWRERIGPMSNARDRLLLDLILGEAEEHARLFRQGAEGRLDLLGRRTGGERTGGRVLATRWVE